jgi:hypothetical protein
MFHNRRQLIAAARRPYAAAVGGPTIWDAASLSNGSLSGGNLTFTGTAGASIASQVSANRSHLISEKCYFELDWSGLSSAYNAFFRLDPIGGGAYPTGFIEYRSDSNLYVNGSAIGGWSVVGGANPVAFGVCVDFPNRLLWAQYDSTFDWLPSGGAGSAPSGGGYDISAAVNVSGITAYKLSVVTWEVADSVTANFGATSYAVGNGSGGPATGYTSW